MTKNEKIGEIGKSIFIGFILFFSAILYLMIQKDMLHLKLFSEKIVFVLGAYVFGVVIIRFVCSLEILRMVSVLFQGAAIVWWILLASILLSVISDVLPEYIRDIALVNLIVLILVMIVDYFYMYYISKELNQNDWKKGYIFWEDLKCKPKNEDEFMETVISYCEKNALQVEILCYGMPARIKMEGLIYDVTVREYCSLSSGVVHAIEFRVID